MSTRDTNQDIYDLQDKKFGGWTVIGPSQRLNGYIYWKCKCICGTESWVMSRNLRQGRTQSCGCLIKSHLDLSGKKFGKLTVLSTYKYGKIKSWLCKCDCGNEKYIRESDLLRGHIISCGCKMAKQILTDQKFGKWTVLNKYKVTQKDKKNYVTQWYCRCECGTERWVNAHNLKSGLTKSCGCLKHRKKES